MPDVAYFLATIQHECANTYRPIEEIGKGKGRPYGTPTSNGKTYYGRGFVQLTWKANYQKAARLLGVDLVGNPGKALEFDTAYLIAARGMREGWFTGKRLSDYISNEDIDYLGARAIINGSDRATQIADYARTGSLPSASLSSRFPLWSRLQPKSSRMHLDRSAYPRLVAISMKRKNRRKVQEVAGGVTSFVGKRSDTIKSFRIFLSQSLTIIGAALSGFYTSNKTMIYIGLAIIAVIRILYFLRQWHLGAIREKSNSHMHMLYAENATPERRTMTDRIPDSIPALLTIVGGQFC